MFRIPENRSIQFIKYKTTCKILCHQILSRHPVIIINNFIEDKLSTTELSQSIEIKKEDEEWAKKGRRTEESDDGERKSALDPVPGSTETPI